MKKILMGLSLSLLSTSIFPIDFFPEDSKNEAKVVMKKVYDSYVEIIPYVYSTQKALDLSANKDERKNLVSNLTDLSRYFEQSEHDKFFQNSSMMTNLSVVKMHLKSTISYINSGNFIFAQKRLNEIGSLCISCHSQLPASASRDTFGHDLAKEKRASFDSDYSYANYLYLVRDFNESKKYFEKSIENNLGSSMSSSTTNKIIPSLRKIVSIDTKIQFNYKNANMFLTKWATDTRLLLSDREIVKSWINDLLKWEKFNTASVGSIPEFIKNNLTILSAKKELLYSGDKDMTLLISSDVLSKYLIDNPKTKQAPEILYWMSLAERQLSQSYYFSLADNYLKECIRKYSKSPFAVECFREYSDKLTADFTGSAGASLPISEKKELIELKRMLKN